MRYFMRNRMLSRGIGVMVTAVAMAVRPMVAEACTSAIVSAEASESGRPLLWKHRDTSTVDNKVEYVGGVDGAYG